jgi:flagellar biosynthesis/type III secretory pathway chaperone
VKKVQENLTCLIDLLTRQAEIYEELLSLADEKKSMILQNDLEALRQATSRENELIGGFLKTETNRMALIEKITGEKEISLSDFIERYTPSEKNSLQRLKQRIHATIDALRPVNARNKVMLDHSLEYIAFTMNILRDAYHGSAYYTALGERISAGEGFIDTRR